MRKFNAVNQLHDRLHDLRKCGDGRGADDDDEYGGGVVAGVALHRSVSGGSGSGGDGGLCGQVE